MSPAERPASGLLPVERWQKGEDQTRSESLAEEVAVALCYNGISYAVIMATEAGIHLIGFLRSGRHTRYTG